MDRSAGALSRIDIPVEEIVEVHAAHIERRHGKANERDVSDVCSGLAYCGRGDDIGPHGWQIGHPAQPQQSLGAGCSHGLAGTDRLAALIAERRPDVSFVDAPVSGSKGPAEQAKLLILASGPTSVQTRLEPMFDALDRLMKDPANLLLSRGPRFRMEAELVRDSALRAAGLLSQKIGGPSVFPPQPAGIYQFTQVRRPWQTSDGSARYRRGLYTFFQRSAPYPALIVFDAPDSTSACTRGFMSCPS